jgi:hypothetical protein
VTLAEAEDEGGLTTYQKYEIAYLFIGLAVSVGFTVWMMTREGTGFYRLRWELERRAKQRAIEAEVRRDTNRVIFEAWDIVTGANA